MNHMNPLQKQIKYVAFGVLGIALIIMAVIAARSWFQDRTVSVTVNEKIERPALNLEFTFPSGDAAYSFIEPKFDSTTTPGGPEAAFIMIDTDEYLAFEQQTTDGETPPTMTIFVYPETPDAAATTTQPSERLTRVRAWAAAHNDLTSFAGARATPEEVVIDGVKALHYQTDGLYPQDVYIALHRNRYYLFVGQYDGEGDSRYTDFQKLMSTVTFL